MTSALRITAVTRRRRAFLRRGWCLRLPGRDRWSGYLSPIVSSLGICILVRADNLWVHPLVASLAMSSKFLIRAGPPGSRSHVLNPANLALTTMRVCERLCKGAPLAQAMTKRGLRRAGELDLDAMLEWEAQAQSILSKTDDAREGVSAFLQKRKPSFNGT